MFAGHAAIFRLMTQASPSAAQRSCARPHVGNQAWELASLATLYMPYDNQHTDAFWPHPGTPIHSGLSSPPAGRGGWSDYWSDNLL